MNFCLGLSQSLEDRKSTLSHGLWQNGRGNQSLDLRKSYVGVVVAVREINVKLCGRDSAPIYTSRLEAVALNAEFIQLFTKVVEVETRVEKRAEKHIAADTCEAVEIEGTHTTHLIPGWHRIRDPRGYL